MALPLSSQDKIIGVLDVQSKESGAFSNEDVEVLQIMADQISMAIENARLLEQSQQTIQELQTLYGERIEEAWGQRLGGKTRAYHFDRVRVKPATPDQIISQPKSRGRQVKVQLDPDGYQHLLIPISLRGEPLGVISLRRNPDEAQWTPEDQQLAEEVSSQLALALDNARLLEESQRRVAQEELLSQASARFSQSLDINTVLQMALRELGQLAGVTEVSVQLTPEE
jgi:GAF domain-containing protein